MKIFLLLKSYYGCGAVSWSKTKFHIYTSFGRRRIHLHRMRTVDFVSQSYTGIALEKDLIIFL